MEASERPALARFARTPNRAPCCCCCPGNQKETKGEDGGPLRITSAGAGCFWHVLAAQNAHARALSPQSICWIVNTKCTHAGLELQKSMDHGTVDVGI